MLKEVDQLLFLEDEHRLTKIGASRVVDWGLTGTFQALQSQIFLRKDVKNLSQKVSSLSSSNSKLKKKVEEAKSKLAKALKEASDKLAKADEKNAQLRVSLRSSEEKTSEADEMLVEAIEKLENAADEAVIHTRGKLMQEYLAGDTDTWMIEKDIKIWEQWKKLKELDDKVENIEPKEQSDAVEQVSKDDVDADPPKSL